MRYVWYDDVRDPGPFPSPALFMRQIHHPDNCTVDEAMMTHGARDTQAYRQSPFYRLLLGAPSLSFHLAPGSKHEFTVLDDLANAGATHYVAYSLPGQYEGQISLVSQLPGGFPDTAIEFIEQSLSCLSVLLLAAIKDLVIDTVLRCYVGSSPAEEIKHGNIRPGAMLELHGAIWFSDIRNYSGHAQRHEPVEFIRRLNQYYGVVVAAIYAGQGEVLKFIGDAILAIFVDRPGLPDACQRALAAAQAANRGLRENDIEFEHGVGLHLGHFQFGNIGSLRRMDFTVIGNDVNLASRIESQCGLRQSELLMSEQFARQCGQPVRAVASTELKGFSGEYTLFTTVEAVAGSEMPVAFLP